MAAGKIAARLGRPVVLGLVTAEGLTKQAYRSNGCSNSWQDASVFLKPQIITSAAFFAAVRPASIAPSK